MKERKKEHYGRNISATVSFRAKDRAATETKKDTISRKLRNFDRQGPESATFLALLHVLGVLSIT